MWKQLLLKKEISREVGNIKETIQKQFQKEINDFPSLLPALRLKKKSGSHYLRDLILLLWFWKTILSNKVNTCHNNCKLKEKSFNSEGE